MPDDDVPTDLAARWYEYWRLREGSRAQRDALQKGRPPEIAAAYEFVTARVKAGGIGAVELLVDLAEAAPPGDDGMTVGIGPLEELIRDRTEGVMAVIAARARQSPAFGRALSHAVMPPDFTTDRE